MALIKCPECENEISDTTTNCPHCGYKITDNLDFKKTEIHSVPPKKVTGIVYLIVGIALMLISIPLFIFFILGGIFILCIACFCIKASIDELKGSYQEAACPYCGYQKLLFHKKKGSVTCPSCKQTSVKSQNYLVPLK